MRGPQNIEAAARRKLLGAWYTPAALVDHVVAATVPHDASVVLDPACGDGAFLAGVRRRFGDGVLLVGVDVDAQAVAAARRALPGAEIVHADALAMDWSGRVFDAVVGNPPFLNQMAAATSRGGRSRFGGGPYADVAAEFLALSLSLARPDGGRVGLVLPQSALSTRDAAPIRASVLERAAIVHAWWSDSPMFDAAVRTCALVLERGAAQQAVTRAAGPDFAAVDPVPHPTGSWAPLLAADPPPHTATGGRVLGDLASFSVDFRDQYYGLIGAVGDDVDGPPLVTVGLIEPGRCLWGERTVRFAKQRFQAPRVDVARLSPRLQRWAERRLVPKILIANQTPTIEAVADRAGAWLPSVPVITCTTVDIDATLDVLSSPPATTWVRHHARGSGLSANAVRLSPALLASIPI